MPAIAAFHTDEIPWSRVGVYHNNDQCLHGAAIPMENRIKGKGKRRPCLECTYWHLREAEELAASMQAESGSPVSV